MFGFTVPPLELILRGSAIYWFLVVGFRVILRRDVGALGIADVLLVVLIADAAQNGMAGDYKSVPDAIVLVSTLMGWNVALDYLAFRFDWVRRWIEPPPLLLVSNGRILFRNLRREFLTVDELMAKLREHGVDKVEAVRAARMESDGTVTVLLHDRQGVTPGAQQSGTGPL